jgi:hypothetical protein
MRLTHPLHCGNKKNPTHLEAFYILFDKTKEINKGFRAFRFQDEKSFLQKENEFEYDQLTQIP